jgi:predicted transposase/invertase (TIGR01784 family)
MTTYLSPQSDITFKKVFGNDHLKSVTISFLNSILNLQGDQKIAEISFVDTANVRETKDLKDSFIDVHCIDGTGTHFLIEMQVESQAWFIQRALYYLSLVFARQLPSGMNYHMLVPVICITILNHIKFAHHDRVISHYVFKEKTTNEALPEQYLEVYFIELPKFKKAEHELETDIDAWLFFMNNAQDMKTVPAKMEKSQEFQAAFHVLDKMKWTEAEFYAYLSQLDKADKPRRIAEAARQEGIEEGVQLGIEQGVQLGIEQGVQLGIEQGVQQEKEAIAIQALKDGFDSAVVAKFTGLSIEQIEILKHTI